MITFSTIFSIFLMTGLLQFFIVVIFKGIYNLFRHLR